METSAGPGDTPSQRCSCGASWARCWCVDCDEALCDDCVSAHRRVTVTRSHRIQNQPPAEGVSTPPTKFCRLHPSEPLKLFCLTCNQLTCRDCQLMAHMNHRYQFSSEALSSLKKQLEVFVQPIRAQRGRMRRSLRDMETRLQDVVHSERQLRTELLRSYSVLTEHLKRRMDTILQDVQKVSDSECEMIRRRMKELKQLQQNQQAVTETAERARNTDDLPALLVYTAQIRSQLKDLLDQDPSPPETMSQLAVVTDKMSLDSILNFGSLSVTWIPFCVSRSSNQSKDSPASSSSPRPLTSTCPAPTDRPLPLPEDPCDAASPASDLHRTPSQKSFPRSPSSSSSSSSTPPLSTRPPPDPPVSVSQQPAPHQSSTQPVQRVSRSPSGLPSVLRPSPEPLPQTASPSSSEHTGLNQQTLPAAAAGSQIPVTAGPAAPPPPRPPDPPRSALSALPSPVVRAVADSACDLGVQQREARQQEPAENEPTSTVSEDTGAAGKPAPPQESVRDTGEPRSAIGHPDRSLSQWQPKVSLVRLPVRAPSPGRPLPAFRLVHSGADDEVHLEELRDESQSDSDDITDDVTAALSPPKSPVTLQVVSCSACGSAGCSIICWSCGRGYHRDCHAPPIRPNIWTEWCCSLCQDLTDPSDPYSSDRPARPPSPSLSLLDQRRCEKLLLHLKVEGCRRLSEVGVWSQVTLMSERLSLQRSPAYRTSAELLSDIWSLLRDGQQDGGGLKDLQESFQSRWTETFTSELRPPNLKPPSRDAEGDTRPHSLPGGEDGEDEGSKVTTDQRISCRSKVKLMRRLREFLHLVDTPASKRTKTDKTAGQDGGSAPYRVT